MFDFISPTLKKWLTVASVAIVAASNITSPIDLKSMIPAQLTTPILGSLTVVGISAFAAIIGAIWVALSETK